MVVKPTVKLTSQFAVPFGEVMLTPCEPLNTELEKLFLAREDDTHRNPTPSHIPQQEVFESRFNLFQWPEPCVRELRQFVLDSVARTVMAATTLQPQDLARLTLHNHTWFHVTRYAGSFIAHNHPMASWSAVYCVRAGEPVPNPTRRKRPAGLFRPSPGGQRVPRPRQRAIEGRVCAPPARAAADRGAADYFSVLHLS